MQQKKLEHYRAPTIWLHWIVGIGLLVQLGLGVFMVDIPRETPDRAFYFNLHKSLGLTLALFIALRFAYRLRHTVPAFPSRMARWERLAARASHYMLYACMILMPVTGYIGSNFSRFGIKFWGIELPIFGSDDKELREVWFEFHEIIAWTFVALIIVHVLAALKHLLIDKDGVFQRILPAREEKTAAPVKQETAPSET
jgi:cytochrome b561